ncbi:MAG: 50S ribosomal protein L10 [Acidimicrobiales bacterium]|nr:50S ribosomal protein L10 [Acidimicrobiales bacterium]
MQGRFTDSEVVLVSEYRGLSVSDLADLRISLRQAGGKYRVYKNTLARRAAAQADLDDAFTELFIGPTALAYADPVDGVDVDVVSIAKALKEFGKTNENLVIKGGLFEGRFIDVGEVNRLAEIEPREVLLSKLAGLMAAPMQQFAGLLQAVPRDFAGLLKALIDEGGAPGAPASEAAPAAEEALAPAADDTPPEADESATDDAAPADDAATDDTPEAEAEGDQTESE